MQSCWPVHTHFFQNNNMKWNTDRLCALISYKEWMSIFQMKENVTLTLLLFYCASLLPWLLLQNKSISLYNTTNGISNSAKRKNNCYKSKHEKQNYLNMLDQSQSVVCVSQFCHSSKRCHLFYWLVNSSEVFLACSHVVSHIHVKTPDVLEENCATF